ncbi:peptide-methionine (S)-S-oxide reductase MsrA [Desulfurispirillum indicum]|uniref:Peptide methionine sulfoxide reductase MsrA n=1 Tax=Desulfurispirillum indicum (strain ATCC BAA-1389 / DSM 22839 / S5) TaxID=653733 RepID=E6W2C0_DESIS|nr:peptide methionine sulfoxide reductase [Desulfurispirillum indicum S5]
MDNNAVNQQTIETATMGGGCFWCTEAVFALLPGVLSTLPGYSGGETPEPTYEQVCRGETGHIEVVQVVFEPAILSYQHLLDVFFRSHDPTSLDRQGNDIGSQYRSVIFFHSPEQAQQAHACIDRLEREHQFPAPIVTQVLPLDVFYPAEPYHHCYFTNNPSQGYCRTVIAPKVSRIQESLTACRNTTD